MIADATIALHLELDLIVDLLLVDAALRFPTVVDLLDLPIAVLELMLEMTVEFAPRIAASFRPP